MAVIKQIVGEYFVKVFARVTWLKIRLIVGVNSDNEEV
jgi:hypothetical protein